MENYNILMEKTMDHIREQHITPRLLLQVCCAPCSSAVLERLADTFDITVFYFNPNIEPEEEYRKRVSELKRFLSEYRNPGEIKLLEGEYDPARFHSAIEGLEDTGEGGARCFRCYELRLQETADKARDLGFDWFTTTLSVSPYKRSAWLNEIGAAQSERVGVPYLFSDFKKKNGYKRSIELSKEYCLYRQDYCGCVYSRLEREEEKRRRGSSENASPSDHP